MEKSGKKATRSRNPKQSPNIVNFPEKAKDASSKPSTPPKETVTDMKVPPAHDGLTNEERQLAKFLGRYKIGKRAYEICPKIGDILERAIGGRQRAIETLKFSKNPEAQKLLQFCEKLSWKTRQEIPIEALCLAAGSDPTMVAGALILAARDVSRMESSLRTFIGHIDVVDATIKDATERVPVLNKEGDLVGHLPASAKAQEMVHKAVGWLPQPKGSSVNVNVFDSKQVSEDEDEDDGAPTMEGVFGSDPMEIEAWGENRRKLLELGK